MGFFVTFNWEVSRKIRAPEDEIEGVDTYTRVFGTYGAAYVVLVLRVIDTALVALVGWHLGLSPGSTPPWWPSSSSAWWGSSSTVSIPTARHARRMETYAGMYVIAFDVILAVAIGARFGVRV